MVISATLIEASATNAMTPQDSLDNGTLRRPTLTPKMKWAIIAGSFLLPLMLSFEFLAPVERDRMRNEQWRLSQECSTAATKAWRAWGYEDEEKESKSAENLEFGRLIHSYTRYRYSNHYNRQLAKCLIRIFKSERDTGGNNTSDEIYDALEHAQIAAIDRFDSNPYDKATSWYNISINIPPAIFETKDTSQTSARMNALMKQ